MHRSSFQEGGGANLDFAREESKNGGDSIIHDSASKGTGGRLSTYVHQVDNISNLNWYEIRAGGKCPDRRAYHSSFLHAKK